MYYLLNMGNKTDGRYYDIFHFGEEDPCELIEGEPNINIDINEYGYKLMGHLYNNPDNFLVFDGKSCIWMSEEQYINFTRNRKLNNILNESKISKNQTLTFF